MSHLKAAITYHCQLPNQANLEINLHHNAFTDLGNYGFSTTGFIHNPTDYHFVTALEPGNPNAGLAFTLRYDEKIIPAAVVKTATAKRVAEVEEEQARHLTKEHRLVIKEEVYNELLSRALIKTQTLTCFYLPDANLLIVPTASKKLAGHITGKLLKAVGIIKSETIHISTISHGLTTKIAAHLNGDDQFEGFTIGGLCKLKDNQGRAAAFKMHDILEVKDGITEALATGSQVIELELEAGGVTFRLDKNFIQKGICFEGEPEDPEDFDDPLDLFRIEAATQVCLFKGVHDRLLKLFEYTEPAAENDLPILDDLL